MVDTYLIMSYSTINKSTKRRRYLEELELIELYDDSVQPESIVQPNLPSCSFSLDLNSDINSSLPTANVTQHDDTQFNDTINNISDDEYDAVSFSSNSDTEGDIEDELSTIKNEYHSMDNEVDSSILNNLAKWAVSFNISQVALSALLKVLKLHSCQIFSC